jgi:enoyl-CoA hydratase/carnithine racemase
VAYEVLQYETRGDVALITLNRPDKLNAWTPQKSLDRLTRSSRQRGSAGRRRRDGRRAWLRRRGHGANVQGASGAATPAATPRLGRRHAGGNHWVALYKRSKPLVAAVNGAAVGIGMTIFCLRRDRRFGESPLRHAVRKVGRTGLASTHLLTARIGLGKASEMCLTGRAQCRRGGILGPRGSSGRARLLGAAVDLAHEIADPDQLRMTKELLARNACETDLVAAQRRESAMLRECWKSMEHKEAVRAFLEKRPPKFR